MKKLLIVLTLCFGVSTLAQTAPTEGKKVLEVKSKYHNEYDLKVFKSFYEAPYNYHMKRLPKKLLKYGFTNVKITALGSVQPTPNKRQDIGVAIAYSQIGANVNTVINKAVDKIDKSEFQVNFISDQGEFKVRLNSTATGIKYIIKR